VPVASRPPLDHNPTVHQCAGDRERDPQAGGKLGRCGELQLRLGLPGRHREGQDEASRYTAARRQ
jgi:hypothetical protein